MFQKILLVCIGNVCRSPTAEFVMRHALDRNDIDIGSAGLQALVGRPIDPMAQDVLREHRLDGASHRARQASPQMMVESDLILVMERKHQLEIIKQLPEVSGKVFLLGKWRGDREIKDPYRQRRPVFEQVYKQIEECATSWKGYL